MDCVDKFEMGCDCMPENIFSAMRGNGMMKHRIKIALIESVCWVLYHMGIVRLFCWLFPRRQVTILFTHQVDKERFESCVRYLKRWYEIVSLKDYLKMVDQGEVIRKNLVVLTFDDGYESNYLKNFPVIKAYDVPVTIFLTAGFVGTDKMQWWDQVNYLFENTAAVELTLEGRRWPLGSQVQKDRAEAGVLMMIKGMSDQLRNRRQIIALLSAALKVELDAVAVGKYRLMSWEQIAEMAGAGVVFVAHTKDYPILSKVPTAEAGEQIERSGKMVQENLGEEVDLFAYPNGEVGDFNEEVKAMVQKAGYRCAVTTVMGRVGSESDLLELNRIAFTDRVTPGVFAVTLSGMFGRVSLCY